MVWSPAWLLTTVLEDGSNVVLVAIGAYDRLDTTAIDETHTPFRGTREGIRQVQEPIEIGIAAVEMAERYATLIMLNPAPARPLDQELLELADIVVPNETGLALLVGAPIDTLEDVAPAAKPKRVRRPQIVMVTLGERGAFCGDKGYHIPVGPVHPVDNMATRDAFVGSLGAPSASGVPLKDAVERSCRNAAASVTQPGTHAH